jgi:hypothetical protein
MIFARATSIRLIITGLMIATTTQFGSHGLQGQQRSAVMVTRLFTGADGLSHADPPR